MIPEQVTILNDQLPDSPGVYFYYDATGKLLYVGKATSLKKRVGSYFVKAHDARIAELVRNIARIEYVQTPTVIEALVLEANSIRKHQPPYNVLQRDDKSFLYLCITNEPFSKPILLRDLDLERMGVRPFSRRLSISARRKFLAVYGPYISGRSLRTALDLVRKSIPWSTCEPPKASGSASERRAAPRPCFDAQIGRCPSVCTGAITKRDYRAIIRRLMLFFEGKKDEILRAMTKAMRVAVRAKHFEVAAKLRDNMFALEHIQDVALIQRDDDPLGIPEASSTSFINVNGRIEAYDIAHTSGTSNVAAMAVFEGGKPNPSAYRRFRIKTFEGTNEKDTIASRIGWYLTRQVRSCDAWPQAGRKCCSARATKRIGLPARITACCARSGRGFRGKSGRRAESHFLRRLLRQLDKPVASQRREKKRPPR